VDLFLSSLTPSRRGRLTTSTRGKRFAIRLVSALAFAGVALSAISGCSVGADTYAVVDGVAQRLSLTTDHKGHVVLFEEHYGADTVVEGPEVTYRVLLDGDVVSEVEKSLKKQGFSPTVNGWRSANPSEKVRVTVTRLGGNSVLRPVSRKAVIDLPSHGGTLVTLRQRESCSARGSSHCQLRFKALGIVAELRQRVCMAAASHVENRAA
jgi:hypothetical protein